MRFTINLATTVYYNRALVRILIIVSAVVCSIVLAWNVMQIFQVRQETVRINTDIAAINARLSERPSGVSEQEYTRTMSLITFYNDVISRKTYNWLALLDLVENATPEGVALMSLAPDKKTGDIKIEGHTKSFSVVRGYLEKIESSGNFSDIYLQSHQNALLGDHEQKVTFTITCRTLFK